MKLRVWSMTWRAVQAARRGLAWLDDALVARRERALLDDINRRRLRGRRF